MWYRTQYQVPAAWAQDKVANHVKLNFQAVVWFAEVWVNGQKLGEHKGG